MFSPSWRCLRSFLPMSNWCACRTVIVNRCRSLNMCGGTKTSANLLNGSFKVYTRAKSVKHKPKHHSLTFQLDISVHRRAIFTDLYFCFEKFFRPNDQKRKQKRNRPLTRKKINKMRFLLSFDSWPKGDFNNLDTYRFTSD